MGYRKNLAAGISLVVFSLLYLFFSSGITTFTGSGSTPLSARFMPRFWGVCLLLLSAALLLRGLRERKAQAQNDGFQLGSSLLTAFINDKYEVLLTFAAICVYIFFLKSIGFIIMTSLYLFAQILILSAPDKRNYAASAITAVIFAVVLDYTFVVLLSVLLPRGIIGF